MNRDLRYPSHPASVPQTTDDLAEPEMRRQTVRPRIDDKRNAPMEMIADRMWQATGASPGPKVCIAFGTHGNERSPIDAGLALVESLTSGARTLAGGSLLLIHANWKATEDDARWSTGGVDLNRCFHPDGLAKEPRLFEEGRAQEIAKALHSFDPSILIDFHCTVEPAEKFAMHHPSVEDAAHREVTRLLTTGVILGDPSLTFGGVSIDEWASTRGKVGICYETGWLGDPANTGESVLAEMVNVLVGVGLLDGDAKTYDEKRFLELDGRIDCSGDGFQWKDGVGQNLQECPAGTLLGEYGDGTVVQIEKDATLVFPKKRPELVEHGKPMVYLASRR